MMSIESVVSLVNFVQFKFDKIKNNNYNNNQMNNINNTEQYRNKIIIIDVYTKQMQSVSCALELRRIEATSYKYKQLNNAIRELNR